MKQGKLGHDNVENFELQQTEDTALIICKHEGQQLGFSPEILLFVIFSYN